MQLIRKYNKGIRFLLCAVDLFSKHARVVSIKENVNAFQKVLDNSKRKPNKIQVDQGSEFYNYQINTLLSVGDHVRISKYKNIFAKGYTPKWSEEAFVNRKIKNTVPWTYVINDLNGEKIIGTFYEKSCRKTSQKEFRTEKIIKRK